MRSWWRDQTRIVTFILLVIFIGFYVFSDDNSTLNSLNTLNLDLESEGNVRFKTGRLKKTKPDIVTQDKETLKHHDDHNEDKPRLSLDNFVNWEMEKMLKKPLTPELEYLDGFKDIINPKKIIVRATVITIFFIFWEFFP